MPNPNSVLGGQEIGVLLSSMMFGIITVQTYLYYRKYAEDRWLSKVLVGLLWVIESIITICLWHGLYYLSVTNSAHRGPLGTKEPVTFNIAVLLSNFLAPVVQAFFTDRIRRFSGILYLPIICWVLSFILFVLGVTAAGILFTSATLNAFETKWTWATSTILVLGAAIDVVIAVSLCYCLKMQRNDECKRSAKLIDKLVAWTMQTGLITSLAAVTTVVLFLASYNSSVYIVFYMLLARLYPNSLLASLNARGKFRDMLSNPTTQSEVLSPDISSNKSQVTRISVTLSRESMSPTSTRCPV